MNKVAEAVVRFRKTILAVFIAAFLLSIIMVFGVRVNYDLTRYLPADSDTTRAMNALEGSFGYPQIGEVMVKGVSLLQAIELKGEIERIEGVSNVMWLDDVADITQPVEFLDPETVEAYYKENNALFQVEYLENGYSSLTSAAIDKIRALLSGSVGEGNFAIGGAQAASKALMETTEREVVVISIIAAVIILGILLMLTTSWLEPVLFLVVIGVAVAINMGTNAFIGEISNITQSTQAILQLAISMDYSIFLFERFTAERKEGATVNEAVKTAIRKSVTALSGSCLTTVAGFAALGFMNYGIGIDLGRVLVKGILISLLSVNFLLPVLICYSAPLLERLRHRSLLPNLEGFAKLVVRGRLIFLVLCLIIAIPAYLAQQNNSFLYGEAGINQKGSQIYEEQKQIYDLFGEHNQVILLYPHGDIIAEKSLAAELQDKEYIKSVQGIVTLADPTIPREMLPEELLENFCTDSYDRMILMLALPDESEETFKAVEDIRKTASGYYDEYYLAGSSTGIYDIKQVVETDFGKVNTISIVAVMIIVLVVFRSFSLPFILTLVIEISIWLNMSIPYFQGSTMSFVGYMIISSIQLGATIDYAILLSDRYLELRTTLSKREAARKAIATAGGSIFTSFLILGTAGLTLGIVSQTAAISEMGILIGRGAFMSGVLVLVLLPQLLVLLDKPIIKTTSMKKYK